MSTNSKKVFIFTVLVFFTGVFSAFGQTDLQGKYFFDTKIDEGRHDFRYIFELKRRNIAIYSNEQNGNVTQTRRGTWSWNKKTKLLTVTLPPVKKNPMMGQEIKLTFVFRRIGDKLKLVKDLPYKDSKGEIYEKF